MRSASLGLVALTLVACGVAKESVESSEAAHTEGDLVWSNDPYSWQEVSQAEIDPALGDRTAPQTHPVAVRLQDWVDRFDDAVRKVVRERTGQVLVAPKPKVRLVADPTVNAYIMGLPTCVATAPAPAAGIYPLLVFFGPNEMGQSPDGFCLEPVGWPAAPAPTAWLNGLSGLPVREANDAILVGDGTYYEPYRAAKVASVSNLSLVNVNAGLVTEMSEKSAAVVIAHELGHYYRAHSSTASTPHYDFWYDRDRHVPERPTPVANQAEYRTQYEQLKVPRFLIPGQMQHPRLGSTLVAWARAIKTKPGHACEAVQATVAKWPGGLQAELGLDATERDLSGAARRAYLEVEKSLARCIDEVKLTDGAATADAWESNEIPRQWFVERLDSPMRGAFAEADLATATTLKDLVETLTTKAKTFDEEAPAFLKRLEQNNIGLYTSEQEADDISMELAVRLGLTPDDVFGSYTELMRWMEKHAPAEAFDVANTSMSSAECEALLAKGFRDGDRDVHVPLGTLEDPHHALCYRLYNLYRENEAHRYVPGPLNVPDATPSWSDLQKQARDLLMPPKPSTPSKPGDEPATDEPTPADPPTGGDDIGEEEPAAPPAAGTTTTITRGCSAAPGSSASSGVSAFVLGIAGFLVARRRRGSR